MTTGVGSAVGDGLGPLVTELGSDRVVAACEALARRGKLPGFVRGGAGGALFCVTAQGTPWDRVVRVTASAGSGGAGPTTLRFAPAWKWTGPWLFALVLVLCVWPGLPITDSLLVTYSRTYETWVTSGWFRTWMWYVPLTVLSGPWALVGAMRKSRSTSSGHAFEQRARIAEAVGGRAEG